MKERIKNSLFPISMFFCIMVIVLSIISYVNARDKITLNLTKDFKNDISYYKKEVNNLSDNNCKNYLNNFISYIEKTNYNGDIYITDYFNNLYINDETLLGFYSKGKESCYKLTDEKMKDKKLPLLFITATMQDDEIMSNFNTQYELNIKDNLVRLITEPDLIYTENSIKQNTELNIIKTMLEIIKEDEVINEE